MSNNAWDRIRELKAQIAALTARLEAAEEALRGHHEQAFATLDDEYPDTPLYRATVAALTPPATEAKDV